LDLLSPYCSKAKGVINSLGLDKSKVQIYELDNEKDGAEIQVRIPRSANKVERHEKMGADDFEMWRW